MREAVLTAEGYRRLQEELEQLTGAGRRELAERIRAAREAGANSNEDGEYLALREEQEALEQRIAFLEERLATARPIAAEERRSDVVSLGSRVRLRDLELRKSMEVVIVDPAEADLREQRLSTASPVGRAILGRRRGEIVEIEAPSGKLEFKIVRIGA